jgi:hypothetical protein
VRPVAVVMRDEDAEHLLEMSSAEDQDPVETLGAGGADERSAMAFAFGARTGVRMISRLSLRKTASKLRLNLLSRSWMTKRSGFGRSDNDQASWRACWVTQAVFGFALQPARWTRRLPSSMKNKTYKRCSRTVSTMKKSAAIMVSACARKNARHERPGRSPAGPRPACRSSLRTVVAETALPRPLSSPAMRW